MAHVPESLPSVQVGSELDNRRIGAALIDLLVPGALLSVLTLAGVPVTVPVVGVTLLWAAFYAFACESGGGQTLGKRMTGIRVVDGDGYPPSLRQAAIRAVVGVLDRNVIGAIAMLATGQRRQRLGDLVAGTWITYARSADDDAEIPGLPDDFRAAPANRVEPHAPAAHEPDLALTSEPRTPIGHEPEIVASEAQEPAAPAESAHSQPATPQAEVRAPETESPAELAAPVEFRVESEPEPVAHVEPEPVVDVEPDSEEFFEAPGPAGEPVSPPRIEFDFDKPMPEISFRPLGEEDRPEPATPERAPVQPAASIAPLGQAPPAAPVRDAASLIDEVADEPSANEAEVFVKPIQTVSAMDLIMQDAEQHDRGS